jgi:hypothetical protein
MDANENKSTNKIVVVSNKENKENLQQMDDENHNLDYSMKTLIDSYSVGPDETLFDSATESQYISDREVLTTNNVNNINPMHLDVGYDTSDESLSPNNFPSKNSSMSEDLFNSEIEDSDIHEYDPEPLITMEIGTNTDPVIIVDSGRCANTDDILCECYEEKILERSYFDKTNITLIGAAVFVGILIGKYLQKTANKN